MPREDAPQFTPEWLAGHLSADEKAEVKAWPPVLRALWRGWADHFEATGSAPERAWGEAYGAIQGLYRDLVSLVPSRAAA